MTCLHLTSSTLLHACMHALALRAARKRHAQVGSAACKCHERTAQLHSDVCTDGAAAHRRTRSWHSCTQMHTCAHASLSCPLSVCLHAGCQTQRTSSCDGAEIIGGGSIYRPPCVLRKADEAKRAGCMLRPSCMCMVHVAETGAALLG